MPERNGDPIVDTVIEHRKDLMKRYPEGTLDLSADNMADALEQARKKARLIANIAAEAKLIVQIQGKDYPKVECWTTLARGYGLTPEIIGEPELIAHPTMAQDRDGNDRYSTEVVLQGFNATLVMLDGRQGGGMGDSGGYSQDNGDFGRSSPMQRSQGGSRGGEGGAPSFARDDLDDEVPF